MGPVGFFYHPVFLQHDTGAGHPERPQRLEAILTHLAATTLWSRLQVRVPTPVDPAFVELVHPRTYVSLIERACREGPTALDPDTIASPGSWEAALRAVGAVTTAIDQLLDGSLNAAFCAVRPPGHHALADRAMGFCLFNNVAIGARYAQRRHHLARILIVDWDVHHGNGTQAIFYDDPSVFYFSTHQFPFYPGTGARQEIGRGAAVGWTLNVPLPQGSGDAELIRAFQEELVPKALTFAPELVLISAGFDAHRDDPLAGLAATEAGYAELTRIVRGIADRSCRGRIVSVLEGGYDLHALGASVEAHLRVLLSDE
ncbi:MAG: histone deacetylase [Candidatus Omnitrophica bacterium]|nr:histone deacetylase [Candidatus Omnitrophota bacterium]